MSVDDYFELSKKHGLNFVTPVILRGLFFQSKYNLTHNEAVRCTDIYIHREKCGDTPACQHYPWIHPEAGKVSRETEGVTGDLGGEEWL